MTFVVVNLLFLARQGLVLSSFSSKACRERVLNEAMVDIQLETLRGSHCAHI